MQLSAKAIDELWYPETEEPHANNLAASSRMAVLLTRIRKLKPFPEVVQRLMGMIQTSDFEVSVITSVIEEDPGLSSDVLRVANSALMGGLVASKSVNQAIVRMGILALRELIYSVTVSGLFQDSFGIGTRIRDHSAVSAGIARHLNQRFNLIGTEDAFVCCLMHDLGKLMLLQTENYQYLKVMETVDLEKPGRTHAQERKMMGFDHAVLGGHMLVNWKVPHPIPLVVAWHHQAKRAYQNPVVAPMVALVRLADCLEPLVTRDHKPSEQTEVYLKQRGECARLKIDIPTLLAEWDKLVEQRRMALDLFAV